MKTLILSTLALVSLAFAMPAKAEEVAAPKEAPLKMAEIGKAAPDFTGTDSNGNPVKLSDHKGKIVVLEWSNNECPFVVKHYGSKNMQTLQKEAATDGVVWLTVLSSAKGKEGYVEPAQANQIVTDMDSMRTATIMDESGAIGHLYGAKTTPHMFVIDKEGVLVYEGAIDDNKSFDPKTIQGAKNYVREALASLKEGKPIETASTNPYGCGVKY